MRVRMWLPIMDLALRGGGGVGWGVACECVWCQCVSLAAHLDVSLWVEVVVPQDDLVVFTSSGQESAVPQLTQCKHAAVVGLDLTADLKCSRKRERQKQECKHVNM